MKKITDFIMKYKGWIVGGLLMIFGSVIGSLTSSFILTHKFTWRSPLVIEKMKWVEDKEIKKDKVVLPVPSVSPVEKKKSSIEKGKLKGMASYYKFIPNSINCDDPKCIMANGEALDDSKFTIALTPEVVSQNKLLNKNVRVVNVGNGNTVIARVTDTGGFGSLGRVADLSVATKEMLGCGGLCEVEIYF